MSTKFKGLKFKIHELPKDADLLEKFPDLAKYKAIGRSKYPDLNRILRYIIYLYDPGSDLIKDIPDLQSRKNAAAKLAGYDSETPELETIMQFKEPKIVDIIQCYLTEIHYNREYREWCTLQQELDTYNRLRLKAPDEKTEDSEQAVDLFKSIDLQGKIRKQCEDIHTKLDVIEKKLFGDDTELLTVAYKSRFKSPEAWSEILTVD